MTTKDLNPSEYNAFYKRYIDNVPEHLNLREALDDGLNHVLRFFKAIPNDKLNYSYAAGKWCIKEVFQHIIDTERVFIYRCFRIARHDGTALAGFEQDYYIMPSNAKNKSIEVLIEEYIAVRMYSLSVLKSLSEADLEFIGNANGSNLSARSAAFIIAGHEIAHINVIKERYL